MKVLIRDDFVFESNCYESVDSGLPEGVLREIKGPLAEWDTLNRNKRKYSEKLWDNVLESPYVKEQLKFKTLLGEANHPSDRYEVDFERVSHKIVEMHKVPDKNQIHGTIQILDTPLGRIIDTLYRSGSIIGYSSRAGGTLNRKKDYIDVDEKTYNFITFDAVPYPSVEAARPGAIDESVVEKVCLSEDAVNSIKSIILESTESGKSVIKDFIYNIKGYDTSEIEKMFESEEGERDLGNIDDVNNSRSAQDVAMQLLKDSTVQINNLRVENATLLEENLKLREKVTNLKGRLDEVLKRFDSKVSAENDASQSKIVELCNTIEGLKERLAEMSDISEDYEILFERAKSLETALTASKLEANALRRENRVLCEGAVKSEENEENVSEALERFKSALNASADEYGLLEESYQSKCSEIEGCKKELENAIKESRELKLTLEGKEIAERKLAVVNESLSSENMRLNKRVSVLEDEIRKADVYKKELVGIISANYGIDASEVLNHLNEGFSKSDVYSVCESLSRETKLSIVSEKRGGEKTAKVFFGSPRR